MSRANTALASSPGAAVSWRLTPPEKIHLTLAFLGEIEEPLARDLPRILAANGAVSQEAPRLQIHTPGTLRVMGGGGALTVRVGCADRALADLQTSVAAACLTFGRGTLRELQDTDFEPHLTLARRVRDQGGSGIHPDNLELTQDLDWTPTALTVTFSTPRPSGSFYEPAGSLPLRPRSQP